MRQHRSSSKFSFSGWIEKYSKRTDESMEEREKREQVEKI
jgi:hypothetical protein